ncbi:MAG: hypothetical protein OS112_05150 [Methanoregula sp.]|nr:MAG: hypothetical protein OS112_05150 [Methanoregula sp.]
MTSNQLIAWLAVLAFGIGIVLYAAYRKRRYQIERGNTIIGGGVRR